MRKSFLDITACFFTVLLAAAPLDVYGENAVPADTAAPVSVMIKAPEDYMNMADAASANINLTIDEAKTISDEMCTAADTWADNYGIQWRAARAAFIYGDMYNLQVQTGNIETYKNKIKDIKSFNKAIEELTREQSETLKAFGTKTRKYAEAAIALNPGGVEGHYYRGAGLSIYGLGISIVKALMTGLGPKFEESFGAAIKIDESFKNGYANIFLGRYFHVLPWPKQNNKKSLEYLLKAKTFDRTCVSTLNFLGDTYYAMGKKDEAKLSWEECMNSEYKANTAESFKKIAAEKLKLLK